MTKTELGEVAAEIGLLWPGSKWEVGTIRASEHLLLDLAAAVVLAAIRTLSAEGERFAPNPGQVRCQAVALSSPTPSADEAMAEVWRVIAQVGHVGVPKWSHPAIGDAVAAMGGYRALCMSEESTMADRAHFLRLYGSVERRHTTAALMPPSVAALLSTLDLSAQRAIERAPL